MAPSQITKNNRPILSSPLKATTRMQRQQWGYAADFRMTFM